MPGESETRSSMVIFVVESAWKGNRINQNKQEREESDESSKVKWSVAVEVQWKGLPDTEYLSGRNVRSRVN